MNEILIETIILNHFCLFVVFFYVLFDNFNNFNDILLIEMDNNDSNY